jgi:hypothetical protein
MKYRILTNEELAPLAEDFKHFLIVNGVHTEEWIRINSNEPQKAKDLVEIFSDTVLQKVYEKITHLEFRSPDSCIVFHFLPEKVALISIQKKGNSEANFSTVESIHLALTEQTKTLQFFQSEKKYSATREQEIHRMLEEGCFISSADFWQSLYEVVN